MVSKGQFEYPIIELYAISEKQFEKSCSLITPEQLIQLIDKYSLITSDL